MPQPWPFSRMYSLCGSLDLLCPLGCLARRCNALPCSVGWFCSSWRLLMVPKGRVLCWFGWDGCLGILAGCLHGRTVCRFGTSAYYFGQVVYGPRWCPCKVRAGRCDRTLRLSSGRRARMRMGIFSRTTPSEPIRTRQPNYVGPNDREPAKLTQRYFIFIFLMACVGSPSVSCV